ncbi:amidohydrolase family protein [Sodalis sp. dw_96]|uniref:amidohydrolase family protein n=1 Tax=Sodalis sp. dw_96 TaxID=2719794 RepID=UPI001BD32A82|nr:amidohydrolase family protein [Sodalis sp. dw_96]
MRIVALEEHFNFPDMIARLPAALIRNRGWPEGSDAPALMQRIAQQLPELGANRLADMDKHNITMQVLSWAGPGAELLPGAQGVIWSQEVNDRLANFIAQHSYRFAGFAHLPVTDPEAAPDELERSVKSLGLVGAMINGTSDGRFLDDPQFQPLLEKAQALGVPLYLHPGLAPMSVRGAYYSGLPSPLDFILSTYGFGWHAEVAIHVLRLVFSGTLDRYPKLRLIIGHMGEFLPMTMTRTQSMLANEPAVSLSRPLVQQLQEQVWVTTSGQFDPAVLRLLYATFGDDRVMFSVDHPYSSNAEGGLFLSRLGLTEAEASRLAYGTADALLGLKLPHVN